jgi:hypothetical protein
MKVPLPPPLTLPLLLCPLSVPKTYQKIQTIQTRGINNCHTTLVSLAAGM